MRTEPDPFADYRSGRLGRVPAFASPTDPARLLALVADALNTCERAGIVLDISNGAVSCRDGYVLPVGESRLGSRWAARMKTGSGYVPEEDGRDED